MTDAEKPAVTSPTAMDMLRESHEAALSRMMRTEIAYLKGEAAQEEADQAVRDLEMTTELLERGLHPGKEAGS